MANIRVFRAANKTWPILRAANKTWPILRAANKTWSVLDWIRVKCDCKVHGCRTMSYKSSFSRAFMGMGD